MLRGLKDLKIPWVIVFIILEMQMISRSGLWIIRFCIFDAAFWAFKLQSQAVRNNEQRQSGVLYFR